MSDTETAHLLLVMAGKDLKALHALLDPSAADDEIFGFHAQQVVGKSLKAWIAAAGGIYGRTHDLTRLLFILEELGCDIQPFNTLDELTPFAVAFRYNFLNPEEPQIDRQDILCQVMRLHDHVKNILGY